MVSVDPPWEDPILAPLLVLWLYIPGYLSNTAAMLGGKWIPEMTGIRVFPIDAGKRLSDGNRILGDGKTWNGFVGGTIGGGILCVLTHLIARGNEINAAPFIDPLGDYNSGTTDLGNAWFYIGGDISASFLIGCVLGFGCMFGDSVGSFVKRRMGHMREGELSSKAPLLDTMPFAVSTFLFGHLFLSPSVVSSPDLFFGMGILLIVTPLIHRSFNVLGYRLGLKSVPY